MHRMPHPVAPFNNKKIFPQNRDKKESPFKRNPNNNSKNVVHTKAKKDVHEGLKRKGSRPVNKRLGLNPKSVMIKKKVNKNPENQTAIDHRHELRKLLVAPTNHNVALWIELCLPHGYAYFNPETGQRTPAQQRGNNLFIINQGRLLRLFNSIEPPPIGVEINLASYPNAKGTEIIDAIRIYFKQFGEVHRVSSSSTESFHQIHLIFFSTFTDYFQLMNSFGNLNSNEETTINIPLGKDSYTVRCVLFLPNRLLFSGLPIEVGPQGPIKPSITRNSIVNCFNATCLRNGIPMNAITGYYANDRSQALGQFLVVALRPVKPVEKNIRRVVDYFTREQPLIVGGLPVACMLMPKPDPTEFGQQPPQQKTESGPSKPMQNKKTKKVPLVESDSDNSDSDDDSTTNDEKSKKKNVVKEPCNKKANKVITEKTVKLEIRENQKEDNIDSPKKATDKKVSDKNTDDIIVLDDSDDGENNEVENNDKSSQPTSSKKNPRKELKKESAATTEEERNAALELLNQLERGPQFSEAPTSPSTTVTHAASVGHQIDVPEESQEIEPMDIIRKRHEELMGSRLLSRAFSLEQIAYETSVAMDFVLKWVQMTTEEGAEWRVPKTKDLMEILAQEFIKNSSLKLQHYVAAQRDVFDLCKRYIHVTRERHRRFQQMENEAMASHRSAPALENALPEIYSPSTNHQKNKNKPLSQSTSSSTQHGEPDVSNSKGDGGRAVRVKSEIVAEDGVPDEHSTNSSKPAAIKKRRIKQEV